MRPLNQPLNSDRLKSFATWHLARERNIHPHTREIASSPTLYPHPHPHIILTPPKKNITILIPILTSASSSSPSSHHPHPHLHPLAQIVKDSALHIFRHIEHTVLADVINKRCYQFANVDLFREQFLHNARPIADASDVRRSNDAVLRCGHVHRNDIVRFENATVGRVHCLYEVDSTIVVDVFVFDNADGDPCKLDETRQTRTVVSTHTCVDACCWIYESP